RAHLRFLAPLFGGQLALNLLFQSDLQLLGRFAADAALREGSAATAADTLAGAYRNAQLFCFLPYQLLLSVTFVLFPLLATAHRDRDRAAVARYVQTGVRLALILAGAMVSVTAGLSRPLLVLVFGADSADLGAPAMPIMAVGLGAFALFGILVTVLTSLGRERMSAALTVAALGLVAGLCAGLLRGQAFGPDLLLRTALATGIGLVLATLGAALAVRRVAGAVAPPATLVRVVLAVTLAASLGHALPAAGRLVTPVYAIVVAAVYATLLTLTRELGRDDARRVAAILRRG
ncbi:MAG: lipid II flippase MurJ, partial [Myxococcota bacterium]